MELSVHTHKIEMTQRLENYVEKKVSRLDKYMPNLTEIRVDLSFENARSANERQIAQVTVRDNRGLMLRAEERHNDMFAAVDAVVDKLYRQISRYRGKQRRRWHKAASIDEVVIGEALPYDEEEEETEDNKIVRTKRFTIKPMSPMEAIDQMDLLGHDFFVFFDAEEESMSVVYKRRDGNYGVLHPELD